MTKLDNLCDSKLAEKVVGGLMSSTGILGIGVGTSLIYDNPRNIISYFGTLLASYMLFCGVRHLRKYDNTGIYNNKLN